MSGMMSWLAVAAGGAIGASLRYGVGLLATRLFGVSFPWGTLAVNVIGSFGLGLAIGWMAMRAGSSEAMRLFLAVGLAGGFTTFSAFALDAVTLWERNNATGAFGYVLASVILSIAALFLGLSLMRNGAAA